MKNIHITLVGGQPSPVHAGIKYINPDEIVFICSEQTYEDAEKIKKMYSSIECKIETINPNHLGKIHKKVIEIYERYKDLNISINLTSGTKSWSLILYEVFANTEAKIILVDQNSRIWDFREKTSVELNNEMNELFINGIPKSYTRFSDYTKEDVAMINDICELKSINAPMFFALISDARMKQNQILFQRGENILEWKKSEKAYYFTLKNKIDGMLITKVLKSENIKHLLINAGWFEYKVASMISRMPNVKEVITNCSFNASNNAPKNEIDIIAHIGNKLLFVECKVQINTITDIDKFSKAARNFGGLGCKTLFVTNEKKTKVALEKCNDNDVIEFSLTNYKNDEEQIDALSKILQREMNTSNAR